MVRFLTLLAAILTALLLSRPALGQADVDIELEQFGVGNQFRPGEIVAFRLQLTSHLAEPTSVWAHVEVPTADGDVGEWGRFLTLQPGRPTLLWLWAPMPPENVLPSVFTARVLEEVDGRTGRELGGTRISPSTTLNRSGATLISMDKSVIGVIGRSRGNLGSLTVVPSGRSRPAGAIENTRVVPAMEPGDLPDRWPGLGMFEAILWSRDEGPQGLTDDTAHALAEWIRWGGHLIIALPAAGDPWQVGNESQQSVQLDIWNLLPKVAPRRVEGVPISEVLPAIAKRGTRPERIIDVTLRVFQDLSDDNPTPLGNSYEPLIALPDGRVIAVQRTFGHGRVTVLGLELSDQLQSMNLPHGDVFWNRVLGRRADTITTGELAAAEQERLVVKSFGSTPRTLGSGNLFTGLISHTGRALLGITLALMLFIAYWIIAGPGGYGVLKAYKLVKHSWVAFFGSSILFTAIAWLALEISPERTLEVKHFSVVDHVARPAGSGGDRPDDPQLQRCTTWLSLYTPTYDPTQLRLAGEQTSQNVLVPWYPALTAQQRFPNIDRFRVDVADDRSSLRIPSRSTATQLYARWMGGLGADWGGMIQAVARLDGSPPIVVNRIGGFERSLSGALTHDLPGELRNVKVIWIKGQRITPRGYLPSGREFKRWIAPTESGKMLNSGAMWSTPSWDKGASLTFDSVPWERAGSLDIELNIQSMYVDGFESSTLSVASPSLDTTAGTDKAIEMLSLFHQLTPPRYLKSDEDDADPEQLLIERMGGRELDLSAWFVRPCIIVIGYLEKVPLPVPLRVGDDDEPPPSDGTVVVRWIYPLPVDLDVVFPLPKKENEDATP